MKTQRYIPTLAAALICGGVLFTSCDRDTPTPNEPGTNRVFNSGEGFFILNEGGFTAGNSSMSYYDMNGANPGTVFNQVFMNANHVPLGDVAQSMTLINGYLYVVVNNSSKVLVLNPQSLAIVATIDGLAGPRNILQVDSAHAWITQMYDNTIQVLDLSTNTITGTHSVGVPAEAITKVNGKIFITSLVTDKLYACTANPFTVDSSMVIAPGGNSMVTDANGKLWVLSYGYWATSAPGGLFRVDPALNTVEASMPFTSSDFATHLCANPAGDSLFYINYNIYRMAISDAALPTSAFISGAGHSFYTIGLMPNTSNFFAGDAVDYVQSGLLFRYNAAGAQQDVDTVGIIPNNFLWY